MIYYWIPPPLIWNMTARFLLHGGHWAPRAFCRNFRLFSTRARRKSPKVSTGYQSYKMQPSIPKDVFEEVGEVEGGVGGEGTVVEIRFWLRGTTLIGFRGSPIDCKRHRLGQEWAKGWCHLTREHGISGGESLFKLCLVDDSLGCLMIAWRELPGRFTGCTIDCTNKWQINENNDTIHFIIKR